ncbi:hypothetical protein KJ632_04470 [Patescibacteria group bacterium]|nr:hypothetical protein [Patescibacteria group bacterium]
MPRSEADMLNYTLNHPSCRTCNPKECLERATAELREASLVPGPFSNNALFYRKHISKDIDCARTMIAAKITFMALQGPSCGDCGPKKCLQVANAGLKFASKIGKPDSLNAEIAISLININRDCALSKLRQEQEGLFRRIINLITK